MYTLHQIIVDKQIKNNSMDGAYSTRGRDEKCIKLYSDIINGRGHLKYFGAEGM
jgi:hypothetical protein